jgi:hypothetical protein
MNRATTTIVIGGFVFAAAVGGYFLFRPRSKSVEIAPARVAVGGESVVASRPELPRKLPTPATAPAREADRPILQSASRDELLAYARDLLARGGPLEDIVALLEYLVKSRPEFAVDLARDIGRSDAERHVLLYATLSDWAQHDAAAALQWAFEKSESYNIPGNASLLYVVLEEVAQDNPAVAVSVVDATLRSKSDGATGTDVVRLTLEALIKTGRVDLAKQAVADWATGSQARRLSGGDFGVIAMALAQKSLDGAGAWLQSLPSSPGRNEAYAAFAGTWVQQDPRAAMDWAQNLNPADGGDDVRVAVFGRWLKSDRPAAAQWLSAQPTSDPTRLRLMSLLDEPATTEAPTH